jgi:hypothetical protein
MSTFTSADVQYLAGLLVLGVLGAVLAVRAAQLAAAAEEQAPAAKETWISRGDADTFLWMAPLAGYSHKSRVRGICG